MRFIDEDHVISRPQFFDPLIGDRVVAPEVGHRNNANVVLIIGVRVEVVWEKLREVLVPHRGDCGLGRYDEDALALFQRSGDQHEANVCLAEAHTVTKQPAAPSLGHVDQVVIGILLVSGKLLIDFVFGFPRVFIRLHLGEPFAHGLQVEQEGMVDADVRPDDL